jgi:hypothetical protein
VSGLTISKAFLQSNSREQIARQKSAALSSRRGWSLRSA